VSHRLIHLSTSSEGGAIALPGLRPGVVLVCIEQEGELRDNALGQVIKLGEAATVIVELLDGNRDAASLLEEAGERLGGPLDPGGLVDLLQALDQRALLDTPRARAVVSQGMIRADVAALRRLSQRSRAIGSYEDTGAPAAKSVRIAPGSRFSCNSCTRCCTDQHLLGPVPTDEMNRIIEGFKAAGKPHAAGPADFIGLPNEGRPPVNFLLRTQNGRCNFLQADGLCGIHQQLGAELKPAVCRLFPFRPVHTPTGWDVGLSLSCPTVASGSGDDAGAEALETVNSLAKSSPLLQVISDNVQLDAQCTVPYEIYRDWEDQAVALLQENPEQPLRTWLQVVSSFETTLNTHSTAERDPWLDISDDPDCQTTSMDSVATTSGLVSQRGQGDMSSDVGRAADILLRDLATWLELLIGLEAADPAALRRVRKGLIKLRSDMNVSPTAAPVLAERARISRITSNAADTLDEDDDLSTTTSPEATRPSIRSVRVSGGDDRDQRLRFMSQALLSKSLFRFSSIRHGLLSITLHLALLNLECIGSDLMSPDVADISYVFQHPQFTDVTDSRAVVRHHPDDGTIHRSILGLSLVE